MNELKNLIDDDNVLSIFSYGSYVYGSQNKESDLDYIVIVKDKESINIQEMENIDINIFSKDEFKEQLENHEITFIECVSLKEEHIIKNNLDDSLNLNLQKLRSAISAKSSNSWVKAKKKLTIEEDYNYNIGIKSAWHAIRILDFGKQIATHGKIMDFSSVNAVLDKMKKCKDWPELDANFRRLYNKTSSEFKLLAPKEIILDKKMKI